MGLAHHPAAVAVEAVGTAAQGPVFAAPFARTVAEDPTAAVGGETAAAGRPLEESGWVHGAPVLGSFRGKALALRGCLNLDENAATVGPIVLGQLLVVIERRSG